MFQPCFPRRPPRLPPSNVFLSWYLVLRNWPLDLSSLSESQRRVLFATLTSFRSIGSSIILFELEINLSLQVNRLTSWEWSLSSLMRKTWTFFSSIASFFVYRNQISRIRHLLSLENDSFTPWIRQPHALLNDSLIHRKRQRNAFSTTISMIRCDIVPSC